MYLAALAFLAIAVATLLAGVQREGLFLIFVSIGASVAAAAAAAAAIWRGRRPTANPPAAADRAEEPAPGGGPATTGPAEG